MTVAAPFGATMPVSSKAVATHIALEPDIAWAPSACIGRNPMSAPSRHGGTSTLTVIWAAPRGSNRHRFSNESSTVLMWCIFSSMVSPGMSGAPETITRPISPSACTPSTSIWWSRCMP